MEALKTLYCRESVKRFVLFSLIFSELFDEAADNDIE